MSNEDNARLQTKTVATSYEAWGFDNHTKFAKSGTLRELIQSLRDNDYCFLLSPDDFEVVALFEDAREIYVPASAYAQTAGSPSRFLPLEEVPEHFPTDEDLTCDRDFGKELRDEEEFFRSRGYKDYDAMQLLMQGKDFRDWMQDQAAAEGKSLDDFYHQIFGTAVSVDEYDDSDARILPNGTEEVDADFTPESIEDARERVTASIVRRRGQPEFRQSLIAAYGGRCAVTGCDAVEALEAAHIMPYLGPATNRPANGLLLRADIHTLFDLNLIAIDSTTMTVVIAPSLSDTTYADIAGTTLHLPKNQHMRPNPKALDTHRANLTSRS